LACGTGDFFLDANRAFSRELSSQKLAYEYHETSGGHTWEYWDQALKPMLNAIDEMMAELAEIDGDDDHFPLGEVPVERIQAKLWSRDCCRRIR